MYIFSKKHLCISEPMQFESALFKGQLAYSLKTHLFEDPKKKSQKNSKTLLRMMITIWY